jgi:hypothetical protein
LHRKNSVTLRYLRPDWRGRFVYFLPEDADLIPAGRGPGILMMLMASTPAGSTLEHDPGGGVHMSRTYFLEKEKEAVESMHDVMSVLASAGRLARIRAWRFIAA